MAAASIAFEAPEVSFQPRPSGARPIDLVHLARQTGGDKALETEVLALFARQAREAVTRLGALDATERSALAHRLAGAAKGVGAFEVARFAGELEAKPRNAAVVAAFTKAVVEVDNFIVGLTRSSSA
ncbi:Hpt domain-containing protein [Hoeflea olei]|uniref:Transcriptional regulator n=1 Tax=Hoeflea olei TaxID=1480615 RepID=A0A1C1YWP9_9HYPH|nr:Hpt domain-containing protein [Hoeflea olei]OCW57983.1 transcriptional regulator [Hoeflea olei]